MHAKQGKLKNWLDFIKWGFVVLLLVSGFVANYYFSQEPLPLRIVGWVVLVCILLAIAFQTVKGRLAWKFFKDARNEMRKVVWPTRHETFQTTLIVIGIVIVFAIIMWGVDVFLIWAVGLLTGQGG